MRIAIVEVIGYIIQELATSMDSDTDAKQTQKKINGLFDLLHERILDVSSYVRTKVFAVLSKIFDIQTPKFPKQRLVSTRAASAALEDKAATVRKAAVSLLIKLLVTHPYGMMHGGALQHEVWDREYNAVKSELEKVEGKVGKAVEVQEEEGEGGGGEKESEDDEDEDEEGEDAEEGEEGEDGNATPKKTKKYVGHVLLYHIYDAHAFRSKKRRNDKSAMDVDEDGEGGATAESDDSEEDDEDSMSVDGDSQQTPKEKKKTKGSKLKPRKSQLDMNALTQEQAALAALEADEHLRLRLKKKYYAEALTFIRQIENSMETLMKLLGSTNKAEVLETMEFFRVAYEYELEGAKVSCFRPFVSLEVY